MATFIDAHDRVDPDFAGLMTKLAAPYQTAKLTPEMIKVYARALSRAGLTIDQVRAMFGKALTECKYFPSVAELLHLIAPDGDDAAMLAWAQLEHLAELKGAYQDIGPDDGIDSATVTALELIFGSWPAFCDMEDGPLLSRKRQEFMAAYRQARLRHAPTTQYAAGLCTTANQQRPSLPPAPTPRSLVGATE